MAVLNVAPFSIASHFGKEVFSVGPNSQGLFSLIDIYREGYSNVSVINIYYIYIYFFFMLNKVKSKKLAWFLTMLNIGFCN